MIRRAMTIEDVFTKNEEDRRFYELREKGRRDFDNAISTAEKRGMKWKEFPKNALIPLSKELSRLPGAEVHFISVTL
jgi:hypothetical protein